MTGLAVLRFSDPDHPWRGAVVMTGVALAVTTPNYQWYAILLVMLVVLDGRPEWLAFAAGGYLAAEPHLGRWRVIHHSQAVGYGLAALFVALVWVVRLVIARYPRMVFAEDAGATPAWPADGELAPWPPPAADGRRRPGVDEPVGASHGRRIPAGAVAADAGASQYGSPASTTSVRARPRRPATADSGCRPRPRPGTSGWSTRRGCTRSSRPSRASRRGLRHRAAPPVPARPAAASLPVGYRSGREPAGGGVRQGRLEA